MFDYDAERLRDVILEISSSNISPEARTWLHETIMSIPLKTSNKYAHDSFISTGKQVYSDEKLGSTEVSVINKAFSLMPRKTGKEVIRIAPAQAEIINEIKPGYVLTDWTAERLCRVCLLMHLDPSDKERYFKNVENLFLAAEMAELVALYSALPVLAYPEMWKMRCAEGVRSNISSVLEALMYGNPYPAGYLDEKAWNQLVMKAFFTDKNVNRIYGFDERANAELALILSDYARERWAAGRSVNPLLWRSTAKFIDCRIENDLEKVLSGGEQKEKQAAALAIYNSDSAQAKKLLGNYGELVSAIERKELTWDRLGNET